MIELLISLYAELLATGTFLLSATAVFKKSCEMELDRPDCNSFKPLQNKLFALFVVVEAK